MTVSLYDEAHSILCKVIANSNKLFLLFEAHSSFSMIKLPVSIFGQTIGYRIYAVSKEPNESVYQKFINKYK